MSLPPAGTAAVSNRDFVLKYIRIRDGLLQQIFTGELAKGAPLPSLRQLFDQYRVSAITARRFRRPQVASNRRVARRRRDLRGARRRPSRIAVEMIGYQNIDRRRNSRMFGQLVGGIASTGWLHDALMTVIPIDDSDEALLRITELLDRDRLDGLLLRVAADVDCRIVDVALERQVQVVLIKRRVPGRRLPAVLADTCTGGRLSVEHLHDLGHRRIGVIESTSSREHYLAHLRGVRRAAHDLGLELSDEQVIRCGKPLAAEGQAATANLLHASSRPTATIANSDFMVPGVYDAIADAGLRIAENVSVVGHDEVEFAQLMSPALTTVRFPCYDLGEASAQMLFRRMDAAVMPMEETLPVELKPRASTAPPARR